MFVFHFPRFSVFSLYSRSYCVHFSFFMFFTLSCHNPGNTVFVTHFSTFFSFLTIVQVLFCVFLILQFFHCVLPYSMSYSVCFSFCTFFSLSHHISCPTMLVSHFPNLSVFLQYARSYRLYFSFFMFFTVPCHIPGHTVFMSHFPRFSVFST